MKRDMDLVREILLTVAESAQPVDGGVFCSEQRDLDFIAYHISMMVDAGLINASVVYADGHAYSAIVSSLTWEGNDFLDAVRSDNIWMTVKKKVGQLAGAATFDVTKALAVKELSALLLQ